MAEEKKTPLPLSIREYEKSKEWRKKSDTILSDKEVVCEICGRRRWKWQPRVKKWKRVLRFAVHHKTYINVPDEKTEDLAILCSVCHSYSHDILRLRKLGDSRMWAELAIIIEKYFVYDNSY